MKLTILGCQGPYPTEGGACSGYLLQSRSTNVLIDCGTGVLAGLPKYITWEALDAVVLSHLHYDHMSDMLPMQYALQFHPRQSPLPVYAPDTPVPVHALLEAPCYALKPMKDVLIGDINFHFHPARHPVESYALVASDGEGSFAYTGDTNEMDELDKFFSGADVLLADAGLSISDWHIGAPHLSPEGCARLAVGANCGLLLLTHLNPKYTPAELEAQARALRSDAEFVAIGRQYEI